MTGNENIAPKKRLDAALAALGLALPDDPARKGEVAVGAILYL
jgi:hypothetical protein